MSSGAKGIPDFAFVGGMTRLPEGVALSTSAGGRNQQGSSDNHLVTASSAAALLAAAPGGAPSDYGYPSGGDASIQGGTEGFGQEDIDINSWTSQHVVAWLEVIQVGEESLKIFEDRKIIGGTLLELTKISLTDDMDISEKDASLILEERGLLQMMMAGQCDGPTLSKNNLGSGVSSPVVMFDVKDRAMMHSEAGLRDLQAALNHQQQAEFTTAAAREIATTQEAALLGSELGTTGQANADRGEGELPEMQEEKVGCAGEAPTAEELRRHEATKKQLSDFFDAVHMALENTEAPSDDDQQEEGEETIFLPPTKKAEADDFDF